MYSTTNLALTFFQPSHFYLQASSKLMKTLVCPDIMNLVVERNPNDLQSEFQPFARKYNAYEIKHWSGSLLEYNKTHLRSGCAFIKGAILSPNCLTVNC